MSTSRPPRRPQAMPEAMNETLARAVAPAELSAPQRDRLRQRVLQQARETTPEGTSTIRAAESWIDIAPFVQMKVLRRDAVAGHQTLLMRMQPGGIAPPHRHAQQEEFIVLEGECHIGVHRLSAGDVHIASAGSWHEAVTTRTGVLVLLRGEYPEPCRQHAAAV